MAMSVGPADGDEDVPMSDINTTPLVDIMLVLLIIFLIAVPVVLQTVPVKLAERPLRSDPDQAGERQPVGSRRARRHLRSLLEPDQGQYRRIARPRGQEARGPDQGRRRGRECDRGEYAGSAYPRRHQHAVQVHRRRRLHHAARWLRAGRLHFRTARRPSHAPGFRSNFRWQCKPPATMLGRADDGNEHDAVDRRPARADHHVHHHHPDPEPCGEARLAAEPAERSRRRRSIRSRTRSSSPRPVRSCGTARRSTRTRCAPISTRRSR